jgi:peptidoglycan-associated lipoprotein
LFFVHHANELGTRDAEGGAVGHGGGTCDTLRGRRLHCFLAEEVAGCDKADGRRGSRRNPLYKLNRILVPVAFLVVLFSVAGCKKKILPQPVATAPPVQVPSPTAQISATPTAAAAGSPVVLTWHTTNAATAAIDGIGDVATSGTKMVTPSYSTNYHLVAHGAGGIAFDDVRVTVTPAVAMAQSENQYDAAADFRAHVKYIFFDYDKSAIRTDEATTISQDAAFLTSHPNVKIVIGGYCDERGSDEYNLALGQNRAADTEKALVSDGVAASRIRVISYGK